MPRRRSIHKRIAQSLAPKLAWGVAGMQAAVLLAFHVDRTDPPPEVFDWLFQAVWAWMHEPSFYPLAGLIVAGIPMTLIVFQIQGPGRFWLALSWAVFVPLLMHWHGRRVWVMLKVLWEYKF